MNKINLGCGKNKRKGFVGIDKIDFGQGIVRNLDTYCLPFSDNSIDEVFSQHFLEHTKEPMDIINEIWRVLKPDGVAEIIVPHKDNPRAYALNHKYYFNENTFGVLESDYVVKRWIIIEGKVNERPDVYVKMMPNKKGIADIVMSNELDIGCGKDKHAGSIGIDITDYGQEVVWDIRKGLPFSDNSFLKIYAHSILEHLCSNDLIFIMNECHRVLKKDGILEIIVPYAGSEGSFGDPTHKSFWVEKTFEYFFGSRENYDLDPKGEHRFKKIIIDERNGGSIYAQITPIKN